MSAPPLKAALTTPCDECPWRRKHPAGWLGRFPAVEFVAFVQIDAGIACHKTCGGTGTPSYCAGALIHYRNRLKEPRTPELAAAVAMVEPSDDVFRWPAEFLAHHQPAEDPHRSMFDPKDRDALAFLFDPQTYGVKPKPEED